MSVSKRLRADKNCLNCGYHVPDIYCSHCGQPNTEPELTLADLFKDFIHVITHFDGKLFQTIRVLFTRPGYLTRAFLDGKRRQYLPPVQMYVFTSAFFFFIFYAFIVNIPDAVKGLADGSGALASDSASIQLNFTDTDSLLEKRIITREDYIHYQDSLPKEKRDGSVARFFKSLEIKINKRVSEDGTAVFRQLIQSFLQNFPKLLFLSLPLMAVILRLIFYRNRSFSYVSHLVFLLHLYIFTLVALLIIYLFFQLNDWTGWSIFDGLAFFTQLWILYYGYRAMRNLYQSSKWKARFQYLIFLFAGSVIMVLLFLAGLLYIFILLD